MTLLVRLDCNMPHSLIKGVWHYFILLFIPVLMFDGCKKDEPAKNASLILKTGVAYTANGAHIAVGGSIHIGVLASGAGVALTYIRIDRITGKDTLTQLDKGIYIGDEGLDADYTFSKDTSAVELWRIMVMNADRDTAVKLLTVYKGSGSAYGPINSFESLKLSFQNSTAFGRYLDLNTGNIYTDATVTSHEAEINLLIYYYVTSGLPSPTFTCPGYTAAIAYYPLLSGWTVKNNTVYDYKTSDNNLITADQFDAATNDSLLVTAFLPDKVSGNCKYGYTGKVVPFKTQQGKYGLIKVIHADQTDDGMMEIAVKIQK
jgi:hypothetical protein